MSPLRTAKMYQTPDCDRCTFFKVKRNFQELLVCLHYHLCKIIEWIILAPYELSITTIYYIYNVFVIDRVRGIFDVLRVIQAPVAWGLEYSQRLPLGVS